MRLADLNDYLGPSQACIKPMMIKPKDEHKDPLSSTHLPSTTTSTTASPTSSISPAAAAIGKPNNRGQVVSIQLEAAETAQRATLLSSALLTAPPAFNQMKVSTKKTATVSLNDCLACSGCVTSAETVLIEQQSLSQLTAQLASRSEGDMMVVVSVSPQSMASLAVRVGLDVLECERRLLTLLRSMGVDELVECRQYNDIALMEAADEFMRHYHASHSSTSQQHDSSPTGEQLPLPLLASECPGWVCYAEKTQGSYILPHMSKVKSPQQLTGLYLKRHYAATHQRTASSIYHVSVQPCPDKKLELSRDEHWTAELGRDVDLALSTGELWQLIEERCGGVDDFVALEASELSELFSSSSHPFDQHSSGGYADHIYRQAVTELFHQPPPSFPLPWQQHRSTDYMELTYELEGRTVLRFARMYGFRHLQSLVRSMKAGQCQYDYVEVMACPSGCVNGGGQLKTESKVPKVQRELVRQVGEQYRAGEVRSVGESGMVRQVYEEWLGCGVGEKRAREMLYTSFKAIESAEINPLTIKW